MPPLTRIGLIGLGRFSTAYHIPNLLRRTDVIVTAVCDTDSVRLAQRHERLQACAQFTDHNQLLSAGLVDGVIISTPNIFHHPQAQAALEHGIHTLVDKPLTMDTHQAAELVTLSKAKQRLLMTAFTRHFMPGTEYLRRQLTQEAAGPVQLITAIQRLHPTTNPHLNGGMFHARTVHLADTIPWLTGQPITTVRSRIQYNPDGYESYADIQLELKNGTPVQIHCIQGGEQYQDEVTVYCSRQGFRLALQRVSVTAAHGIWDPVADPPQYGNSTDHFIEAIQGVSHPPDHPYADCNSHDGLQALRVLEGIVEANRSGAPVHIPPSTTDT